MAGKNKGPVEVFVTKELFNSLLSVLDDFIKIDEESILGQSAVRLKNKIMRYGREFLHNQHPNVAVNFYPEEAGVLIKLLVMHSNASSEPTEDFFSIFREEKIKKLKVTEGAM